MNALQEMTEHRTYQELVEALAVERETAAEPEWLSALRRRAYERFQALGFPTRKSEAWKYIHLEPLLKMPFVWRAPQPKLNSDETGKLKKTFLSEVSNRLVFVNGYYQKDLSAAQLPQNAIFGNLVTAFASNGNRTLTAYLGHGLENEANPFTAINSFSFQDGVYLYLPKGVRVENPLEIIFVTANPSQTPFVSHPRIFVFLEEGASAQVVVQHVDLAPNAYFLNGATEIYLGKNATLAWTDVHSGTNGANSLLSTQAHLQENSFFQRVVFFQDAALARDEINVAFKGERASCELSGLSVLSENSQVFHHVKIKHGVPSCTSRQVYKNILAGRAQAEFNSLVHVLKGASKSSAEQVDKNLLLSDSARAYSRPQLRIDNDDVQCSHGATTGQFEKDELFYLQSRGLARSLARQMLTLGFAKEVLERVPLLELRRCLEQRVQEKIQAMIRDEG